MALTPVRTKGTPQRPRPMSRNQRVSDLNLNSDKQSQSTKFLEKGGEENGTTENGKQIDTHPLGNGRPIQLTSNSPKVSKENGSPKRVGPSDDESKLANGPSLELPNQPTPLTPLVVEPLDARTSQLDPTAAATVKWKATLSLVDNSDQTARIASPNPELILSLERNDSSLSCNSHGGGGTGDSPRNLLSAAGSHAGDNDSGRSPANRKLSLGDFITETVHQDQQTPVKWDTLETKNELVNSLPYVPVTLAYICLIMNVIIPGSGTILAGMSMMCCGEPRGQTKPDELFNQFTTNVFVGISQFFTVPLFLAGWIWSISWGVYLVLFAEENRLRKAEEVKMKKTAAIANTLWDR